VRSKQPPTLATTVYTTDDDPGLASVLYTEFNQAVLTDYKFTASRQKNYQSVESVLALSTLIPSDMEVVRQYSTTYAKLTLVRNDNMILLFDDFKGERLRIYAAAKDYLWRAENELSRICSQIPDPVEPPDDVTRLLVWMLGSNGPRPHTKEIVSPVWSEVENNWPGEIREKLAEIMADEEPEDKGKIILWHGAPGTGKTSAIRTLMHEWKDWCSLHYVSDPEKLFTMPGYLLEVGAAADSGNWRLVVVEDTDEFLRLDAREKAGAAMGRLLNFSDGILGQGSNTIFLLTTNEKADQLHPAITRPGRCYNHLQFRAFTVDEANDWLDHHGVDTRTTKPMTLAELIAIGKVKPRVETLDGDATVVRQTRPRRRLPANEAAQLLGTVLDY
jgi:hypothetical protein